MSLQQLFGEASELVIEKVVCSSPIRAVRIARGLIRLHQLKVSYTNFALWIQDSKRFGFVTYLRTFYTGFVFCM